jgi:chaperonin GroEL
LASGIAIIGVGAATQIEMIEKKHRIEDALGAVKAAQLGGIHAGGGAPLIKAAKALKPPDLSEEQKIGFDLVLKATKEPIRQMALNAGKSPDLIVNMVEDGNDNCGYDFAVGKITNLVEDGIIDPVQVTCSALQNAVSVASILITTDYAIVEAH